jgi:hypothetical protein
VGRRPDRTWSGRAPPGLRSSTLHASANAARLSGKNIIPNWQATRSYAASSKGRSMASACRHAAPGAWRRPRSTIASFRSLAVTSATGRASSSALVNTPVPAASSSTRRGAWDAARRARSTANGRNTVGTSHRS